MKKRSSTFYRKKCVAWAKEQAKKRDGYCCQYCGVSKARGASIHASHILPEGAYPLMSVEPLNIISLCAVHHLAGANPRMSSREPSWHGDPTLFAKWFSQNYPGLEKRLREMDREKERHLVDWKRRWEELKSQR